MLVYVRAVGREYAFLNCSTILFILFHFIFYLFIIIIFAIQMISCLNYFYVINTQIIKYVSYVSIKGISKRSFHLVLRGLDTLSRGFAFLLQRNFCDFLFAFMYTNRLLRKEVL